MTEWNGRLANGSSYRLFNYGGSLTNLGIALSNSFLTAHPGSTLDTSIPNQVNLLVVPEPSSFAMLLGGIGSLLAFRRRRQHA